jgi:hypothetical protein
MFSGYWHGVAIGYLLWAGGHFLYFKFYPYRALGRFPIAVQSLLNFVVISLLWLPFSLGGSGIFRWADGVREGFHGVVAANSLAAAGLTMTWTEVLVAGLGLAIIGFFPAGFEMARSDRYWTAKRALSAMLIVISLHEIFASSGRAPAFVYFQF